MHLTACISMLNLGRWIFIQLCGFGCFPLLSGNPCPILNDDDIHGIGSSVEHCNHASFLCSSRNCFKFLQNVLHFIHILYCVLQRGKTNKLILQKHLRLIIYKYLTFILYSISASPPLRLPDIYPVFSAISSCPLLRSISHLETSYLIYS